MSLYRHVIETEMHDFLNDIAHKARYYFRSNNIQDTAVVCVLPNYFIRNLQMIRPVAQANPEAESRPLYGFKTQEGYENKIVFYWPDWFYRPHIKPIVFDIPEQFKIKIDE